MSIQIKASTFPESVADGTIANWLKKEGASVNQDEVIAEIETDKVVLEVLAQSDGVIIYYFPSFIYFLFFEFFGFRFAYFWSFGLFFYTWVFSCF